MFRIQKGILIYIVHFQLNAQNQEQVDISNVHLAEGIGHLMILQVTASYLDGGASGV
jgi:hypothetical protein